MFQTLANVLNAYWDLVFAQSAVDVAQRALELSNKLVEDNQARVEVGTLAPLDIVQAEAATRRQNLAAAFGIGEGAELQAPLARVVIGGLLTSTVITLVFVPAMDTLFEEGWGGILRKGAVAPAEAAH